jgi:hypothetical protein
MGCAKTGKNVTKRLSTLTTEPIFEPFSDWMPAIGVDNVKMVIKRRAVSLTGTAPVFNVKPAIQVALVRTDYPDAWANIGALGPYTGAGEDCTSTQDISDSTGGKFFVRFGVSYYLSGTSPLTGQADVDVTVSYTQCGSVVASMTQELQAFNTTSDSFKAITGWISALDADAVVAAFVASNVANNFRWKLFYRTATTSIQTPGAWNSLEASYRSTNQEDTTGEVSLSIGAAMYVQFGVGFSQSTAGSAPGQITLSSAVAVRRA